MTAINARWSVKWIDGDHFDCGPTSSYSRRRKIEKFDIVVILKLRFVIIVTDGDKTVQSMDQRHDSFARVTWSTLDIIEVTTYIFELLLPVKSTKSKCIYTQRNQ